MATSLNSSDMTVNMVKKVMMALLGIVFLAACSSSDDDDLPRVGLTGKWDLVEIHDGPVGRCQSGYVQYYSSGSVIIELDGNGKIVFKYADGKVETHAQATLLWHLSLRPHTGNLCVQTLALTHTKTSPSSHFYE